MPSAPRSPASSFFYRKDPRPTSFMADYPQALWGHQAAGAAPVLGTLEQPFAPSPRAERLVSDSLSFDLCSSCGSPFSVNWTLSVDARMERA